jgi:hypothetical protein
VRRDRISLDLRGLGPALRTLARARGITVACAAREILVAELGRQDLARETRVASEVRETPGATVKVTIRLRASDARELRRRVRACGASYGGYVKTLIEGAPLPHVSDRKEVLDRLSASTDQLAAAFADINDLRRLLLSSACVSAQSVADSLSSLSQEVREHLALSSSVILELKPAAVRTSRTMRGQGDGRSMP